MGDTGLLFNDPAPISSVSTPSSTPQKNPTPSTPSKSTPVPECLGVSSKQVFPNRRTRRECVVCRFEGRPATISTTYCKTHMASLCMRAYDPVFVDVHVAPDQTNTCWRKYHDYYFPNGLFNANGNVRRLSGIFTSSKCTRASSFDTHVSLSSHVSTDYPGSPHTTHSSVQEESVPETSDTIAEESYLMQL